MINLSEEGYEAFLRVYEQAEYSPLFALGMELDHLYQDITGKYTLGLSYSTSVRFKRAYEEDKEGLRKVLIALINSSNSYFKEQITKYPSLKEDYDKKIKKNENFIEQLKRL